MTATGFRLRHCHGINRMRNSDKCQQARSLAMQCAVYRQTGKRQKVDIAVMTMCHTKKQKVFQTTQATTRLYNKLAWVAPLLSRRVLRGFCRSHFGIKSEELEPNSGILSSSEWKRNHKSTNRQWSHHINIGIQLHKLYAPQIIPHCRLNRYAHDRLVSPRLTHFDDVYFI